MVAGPGAPNNSGIPGFNAVYGIVAHAGGGNANATPLNGWLNTIVTVVTAADSVMLPPGYAGAEITVLNRGAASAQVFGFQSTISGDVVTDTIIPVAGGAAVTTGVALAANAIGIFWCVLGQSGQTNAITPAVWQYKAIA
jgi:hypothetical protein